MIVTHMRDHMSCNDDSSDDAGLVIPIGIIPSHMRAGCLHGGIRDFDSGHQTAGE